MLYSNLPNASDVYTSKSWKTVSDAAEMIDRSSEVDSEVIRLVTMSFLLNFIYSWYRRAIRHPQFRWWVMGATLVYLLSPVDILPDVIPGIGEIDDAVIVTMLAAELSQLFLDRMKTSKTQISESASLHTVASASIDS